MIYTFKRKRIVQACGCLALTALASAFLLMGLSAPSDYLIVKGLAFSAAALLYAVLIPILRETFTPGPILTIGPEGLTYQPFSLQPIPWLELTAITRVRGYVKQGQQIDPRKDVVRFAVRDVAHLALRGGFGGGMMATQRSMFGGATQIDAVRASADEIIAAIKTYWRGDIAIVSRP